MNIILRAWDDLHNKWIYTHNDDVKFVYENKKWTVYYTLEKTIVRDGIEMDVPTIQQIDDADVEVYIEYNNLP